MIFVKINDSEEFQGWYDLLNPDEQKAVEIVKEELIKFSGTPNELEWVTFLDASNEFHADRMVNSKIVFITFIPIGNDLEYKNCIVV